MEQLGPWQRNMVETVCVVVGQEAEQKVTKMRCGDILQRPGSEDIFPSAKPYS